MDNGSTKRRLSFLSLALIGQLLSAVIVISVAWRLVSNGGDAPPLMVMLVLQGTMAALVGFAFGLRRWWLIFQLLLPTALAIGVWAAAPSWVYFTAFLALLLVYWNSANEKVPLYLTNRKTWDALEGVIPDNEELTFIDIGCGFGGVLTFIANKRTQGHFTGVESAPVPFVVCWLRQKFLGPSNVHIQFKDYWEEDLSSFDVVYCFLSPAPMADLYEKARLEMRQGSLFISNSFEVPDYPHDEVITVNDRRNTKLLIWRM